MMKLKDTNKIVLRSGKYGLFKPLNGKGDSGPMLRSIDPYTDRSVGKNGELHKGCAIQCGDFYEKAFGEDDWYMTPAIVEFLETNADNTQVKFSTKGGHIYVVRCM